jgi:3-hydroxyacyl-CoA dehydrogenase
VKDGIATTGEIDDAIRYGFGLRWAQMGCSRPTASPAASRA